MSDGAWAYVENFARAHKLPVRECIPIILGRGIDASPDHGDELPFELASLDPNTPVIGPDGLVYEAQELPGIGRKLGRGA